MMRLYKIDDNVEFPEKVSRPYGDDYLNLRSMIRIDVRPEETILVPTGFRISLTAKQKAFCLNSFNREKYELSSGDVVYIEITNHTKNNYMISIGQSIGSLEVHK